MEFHALQETRSKSGVREITQLSWSRQRPYVASPEYSQATAEVRSTRRVWYVISFKKLFRLKTTGSPGSSSYTDLAVNSLVAAASGVGDGGTLAVSEACARWWSSALTSASVAPDVPALAGLTPSTLALIGRELFHRGESLFYD